MLCGTGWQGGAVLAAFFVSSNLVSRVGPRCGAARSRSQERTGATPGRYTPTVGRRRWVPAWDSWTSALGIWLVTAPWRPPRPTPGPPSIGIRSRVPPRLLWSGRTVPAGTNGGMTLVGQRGRRGRSADRGRHWGVAAGMPLLLPVGTLIGFLGMVVDSTLGALLQGRFHCPACDVASEWRVHRCGAATTREGGMAWLNNDGVNFVATALAGCAALAVWRWLSSG